MVAQDSERLALIHKRFLTLWMTPTLSGPRSHRSPMNTIRRFRVFGCVPELIQQGVERLDFSMDVANDGQGLIVQGVK